MAHDDQTSGAGGRHGPAVFGVRTPEALLGSNASPAVSQREECASARAPCSGARHFRHQREHVVFRIAKRSQPQSVRRHARDERRLAFKAHTALRQCGERRVDIRDPEVEDRTRVVELSALRHGEHQAHAVAIEEG